MNRIRVLLIDDEVDFTAPLSKRLGKRGFAVRTVAGGQEALQALAEEEPEVVLLDMKMAGMDGIKTLSALKRSHPLVEVIMLTAHANTDIVISSLAMGAFDYLLKPVELEKLVLKIEDAAFQRKKNLRHGNSCDNRQE
ncbi:response regulator [Pseudodesulfovibrio sediminis]|uniref:Two-component system response regulator n=1 Tax=Pseudodesulfovibrio sediminis TaxID=2810563 RepID=A0ABN6EWU6_9BACT|nr:response regulator [Pseudodesulfovibrio sediminis]BCS89749.1 two-component system response regulator [Pseudodesulfovibrio sediminis]